jgi:chemotaxis protein CheX
MSLLQNTAPEASKIVLAEVLDLKAASILKAELLDVRGRDVDLDGSAVQRLGAQCLQVLLSALSTWEKDGAALQIFNPSHDLVEGLELLGVDPARCCAKEARL